jgi:hypothetical protein
LEPELPDPPPYVPLVGPTAPASPRPESDSEDPNRKEEASEPNLPMSSNGSLIIPPLPLMALEKDMNHWGRSPNWEANKQGGRNPGCGAMAPAPGSRAAIVPGRQVICDQTHAVRVPAFHYHQPPELAAAHPSILRETTGCNGALDQHHAQPPTQ